MVAFHRKSTFQHVQKTLIADSRRISDKISTSFCTDSPQCNFSPIKYSRPAFSQWLKDIKIRSPAHVQVKATSSALIM